MPEIEVSIVMSVYNAERYLREAIDSILTQTFSNFEFIIVNDGSTDNSLQIIESYKDERIVLLNQANTGLAKALNKGIEFSKGRFIARMDADDISLPNRLQKQYDFFKRNPEYIAVGSSAIIIDFDGNYIFTSFIATTDDEAKKNLPKTPFYHSAVMFQKKEFLKAGKYCEAMIKSQDTVLFNRMAKYGKFYNIKEPLIRYRIVPTANSTRSNYGRDQFLTILEKAIKINQISNEDKLFLKTIFENRDSTYRLSNYYLFLAKKYLWNNYKPKIARKNIFLSIRIKLTLSALLLFFVSFLPERIICELYKRSKKLS